LPRETMTWTNFLNPFRPTSTLRHRILSTTILVIAILALTGCLEQYQPTRLPQGALFNFMLHLQNGELEDAQTYFAPGLVTPSAELDQRLIESSDQIKKWDTRNRVGTGTDLPNGERIETISGDVRPRTPTGSPTPGPDEGWQQTDIISATMIFRGPGWRILDYKLLCCTK
jgi:hypothetical protein